MLAVSSLAWSDDEEFEGMRLLGMLGVSGIELIPRRLELHSDDLSTTIATYRQAMDTHGLTPVAMQAIYYGAQGLQILQSEEAFDLLVNRSVQVAAMGDMLGVPVGVLGAPGVRRIDGLSSLEVVEVGQERLHRLDKALGGHDFKLALEPVPAYYGNHFLTSCHDIHATLKEIGAKNLALQLDIGCISLGEGDVVADITNFGCHAAHYHISEKDLGGFDTPLFEHARAGKALNKKGYTHAKAIEMKRDDIDWRKAIECACSYARAHYTSED